MREEDIEDNSFGSEVRLIDSIIMGSCETRRVSVLAASSILSGTRWSVSIGEGLDAYL